MLLSDGDKALVRAFMAWLRAQDMAICVRVDEPEWSYERVLWEPLSCGSAQLVADFAADLAREEQEEASGVGRRATEEQEQEQEQEQGTDALAHRLRQTMDPKEWAHAFMRIIIDDNVPIDEGLMIGWFANAIMTGWDFSAARSRKQEREEEGRG